MKLKSLLIFSFLIFTISCTNSKESDLELVACEDVFTYTECIKQIIDANCVGCHHSGANAIGPFSLETYDEVRNAAENGNLLTRIQLDDGADGIMPQTGKMPQSKIDAILLWVESSYQE